MAAARSAENGTGYSGSGRDYIAVRVVNCERDVLCICDKHNGIRPTADCGKPVARLHIVPTKETICQGIGFDLYCRI